MIGRTVLCLAAAALVLGTAGTAGAARYSGTVGPDRTITLKNRKGKIVKRVPAGKHTFVVRDRSGIHNFVLARGTKRLQGTGVEFVGTVRWTVRIRRGAIYHYYCSTHREDMTRSFRVKRAA